MCVCHTHSGRHIDFSTALHVTHRHLSVDVLCAIHKEGGYTKKELACQRVY